MSSSGPSDWNRAVIEEFRANAGRVGGTFAGNPMVLLHHINTAAEAIGVANKIRQAIDQPFCFEGHACSVSASIGIALYPDDGDDADTLTRRADEAMYRSKAGGRSPADSPPEAPAAG